MRAASLWAGMTTENSREVWEPAWLTGVSPSDSVEVSSQYRGCADESKRFVRSWLALIHSAGGYSKG